MSEEILGKDLDEYLIPVGASRIQVIDTEGKTRWRKVGEVRDEDKVPLDKQSKPYYMASSPGRKSKPQLGSEEYINQKVIRKRQTLHQDAIRAMARRDPESPDVLQEVMVAISEEAAALKFEREQAEINGDKATVSISLKRVQALKAIGDTWLKRKEMMASGDIDLDSPQFEKLLTYIFETFGLSLEKSGVRGELGEAIFSNLAKALSDKSWKAEARRRMKK